MGSFEKIDRRAFLGRAARAGAGAALFTSGLTSTIEALGAPGALASPAAKSLGSASLQLDWIEDIEFAGSYIAKSKGFYTNAGIDVTLLPGGPNTSVEPIVVSGKALVGISGPDLTSTAIDNGADLVIIGAQMQKAPQAIMSLAKKPILNPDGMIGKKIGVQAGNLLSFKAFLKLQGIPMSKIDVVPVQFDPTPLADGEVDGWYAFITNEPFLLAAKGVATKTWLLYDYGYKLYSGTYLARASSLRDSAERAQVVALMKGEIQGWEAAFANPPLAAHLTVDVYGKNDGLDVPTQQKELAAYEKLFRTPATARHGLMWMSAGDVAANIKTLGLVNIKSSPKYFTNEILEEVFHGANKV
jgi:ABC-type nitrate/sulfonate/bicarbonate transport system substrate-binding protein